MKYLVMECRPAYAVVLGDDGTFQKVANIRYEVGQTVTDVIPLKLPEITEQPKTNHKRWISSFAAMAACLALLITSVFFTRQMPYASVYMTINPEVRIDVSRSDVVVGVEGMNADGAALLEGYDHKKKDLDTVMDELVDRAIDMGYLHEGGRITLSLDGNETWVNSHSSHLNDHLKEHLEESITVTIDVQQKPPEKATPATPKAPAVPTAPTAPIVIPIIPNGNDDSDDGEAVSDYHTSSDYDEAEGDSSYDTDSGDEASDYGDSDYGAPVEDSDYDDTNKAESDDSGESEFDSPDSDDEASDYDDSDYGASAEDSDYDDANEAESDYTGESEFDSPDSDDPSFPNGQSDYGDSGFDESDSDDGNNDYSDYGQSDYDESDYDD